MTRPVGWGVVGTGGMGRRMASAVAEADGAALVAVCSRSAGRAAELAAPFGATPHTALAALVADPAVEIVYLATETDLHAEQAVTATRAGKHVLVEKPMALSVADARRMAAAADAAGVRLGVGFHLRHHPVHAAMRELIAAGELGEVVLAQALWGFYSADWPRGSWKMDPARAGAGSVAALGVHLLDLLSWLVGRDVVEALAVSDEVDGRYPVEFLTAATLRFEGGPVAQLVSSRRLRHTDDDVTVYLEHGRLRGRGTLGTEPVGTLELRRDAGEDVLTPPLRDLYTLEAEACSAALREERALPTPAADGIRSVALTQAVLESARTGRVVRPASEG